MGIIEIESYETMKPMKTTLHCNLLQQVPELHLDLFLLLLVTLSDPRFDFCPVDFLVLLFGFGISALALNIPIITFRSSFGRVAKGLVPRFFINASQRSLSWTTKWLLYVRRAPLAPKPLYNSIRSLKTTKCLSHTKNSAISMM